MNELEKKSFYSFVFLYLISSTLFILLSSYWYYSAQKEALENSTYYKLTHIADVLSGNIINAQMKGITLELSNEEGYVYQLISTLDKTDYKVGYFEKEGFKVIISDAPHEHLNIKYVIVKSSNYFKVLHQLKIQVLTITLSALTFITLIAYFLAKLFMRPLHQRIKQIEQFLQDVTHELNTPITAIGMSVSRALKKEVYNKKILTNISISTKQLKSIYNALVYLNFKDEETQAEQCDMEPLLQEVIAFYSELLVAKNIIIKSHISAAPCYILQNRATLLFSNLLSNAIKYSMPDTTITITLKPNYFSIEDEGIGIAKEKLHDIFKLYERHSHIAGGFGIGLSIVRQICDRYDIAVDVASELEVGTTFELKWHLE